MQTVGTVARGFGAGTLGARRRHHRIDTLIAQHRQFLI
jgi:hypothetical protein